MQGMIVNLTQKSPPKVGSFILQQATRIQKMQRIFLSVALPHFFNVVTQDV